MGGFIPNCHAQTIVKMAKLEIKMNVSAHNITSVELLHRQHTTERFKGKAVHSLTITAFSEESQPVEITIWSEHKLALTEKTRASLSCPN